MKNLQRIRPPVFPVKNIVIPEVNSVLLNNGVPVYIIEAGTEEIMRFEFTFRAGQVKEDLPLISSTTNIMLTEGSQNFTSEELSSMLDYYGAFLNLVSEKDRAGIVIFFLNKHMREILGLTMEILFRPAFPEDELNSLMKKRIRWYQISRDKVQNLAFDQFFESIFGKHNPYGYQVVEDDFKRMTPELLRDFHASHYSIDNMAVIISGKIPEKTIDLLNEVFENITPGKIKKQKSQVILKGERNKHTHIKKSGALQSAIRIGCSSINMRHPDYPGLKILDTVIGGYFGSRLMKNIREEKGYTYGISSGVHSLDLAGYQVISTEVSNKYLRNAIDEIYREIRLLQTIPVEKGEMDVVRNYMSGEMVRMFDGPFALADSFKSVWEFGLDNNYYYRLAEKIKTIDSDEIIELAGTYYNIDKLYEITAGA